MSVDNITPECVAVITTVADCDPLHYWAALRDIEKTRMTRPVIGELAVVALYLYDRLKEHEPDLPDLETLVSSILNSEDL